MIFLASIPLNIEIIPVTVELGIISVELKNTCLLTKIPSILPILPSLSVYLFILIETWPLSVLLDAISQ